MQTAQSDTAVAMSRSLFIVSPFGESAAAKALMHVQRKYRHRETDDQERNEDHPHDREQSRN